MNGHGGKRSNSGRKASAATEKTREIADQEAASGEVMPLTVMLHAMREHYDAGRLDKAAEIAKDAAPYCHSKLAALTLKGDENAPLPIEIIEIRHAQPDRRSDEP